MSGPRIYVFDEFQLDTTQWTLLRGTEAINLEPKVFDTLLCLLQHAGQIISKEEIIKQVWPGSIVEEGGLTRNISLLRQALHDKPPFRFIETVRNQGYRFCAKVEIDLSATKSPPAAVEPAPKLPRTKLIIGLAALLLLSVIVWCLRLLLNYASAEEFTLEQLTTNSAELPVYNAAISPDGKILAFTDSTLLFVSDVHINERHAPPLPKDIVPTGIDWFPDSTHVLISGINRDSGESSVWRISILGDKPELLMHDARLVSASPDGKYLAFVRNDSQLWIANSDGSAPQLFADTSAQGKFFLRTQFSDDGRYILTMRIDAGGLNSDIEAHRIRDGKTIHLYGSNSMIRSFCLVDNNELLLSVVPDDSQVHTQLVAINITLEDGAHSKTVIVADWPGYWAADLSTSVTSKIISVIRYSVFSDAYIADLAADENTILHTRRLTLNNSRNRPAGWFHDNHTALFYSNRLGQYGIYSQDINSTEENALVTNQQDDVLPVITADQRWLFYFATDAQHLTHDLATSLMRVSMNGGTPQLIDTKSDYYRSMRCAALVMQCVLEEHTADERIFVSFDPERGRGKELMRAKWTPGISLYDWDISSDGTRIAYIDEAHDPDEIAIFDFQSPSQIKRVHVNTRTPLHTLLWDAKSDGFFASAYNINDRLLKLFHIDADGNSHMLRSEQDTEDGWAIPSPDGKHLLMQKFSYHSNIWLMKH